MYSVLEVVIMIDVQYAKKYVIAVLHICTFWIGLMNII